MKESELNAKVMELLRWRSGEADKRCEELLAKGIRADLGNEHFYKDIKDEFYKRLKVLMEEYERTKED